MQPTRVFAIAPKLMGLRLNHRLPLNPSRKRASYRDSHIRVAAWVDSKHLGRPRPGGLGYWLACDGPALARAYGFQLAREIGVMKVRSGLGRARRCRLGHHGLTWVRSASPTREWARSNRDVLAAREHGPVVGASVLRDAPSPKRRVQRARFARSSRA